jgi:CHAT domain-containing protein
VHLATHGELDSADPMASKVFLAQDQANEGQLLAAELYEILLNASLVTLSACETGLAAVENGDELIGLVRGFFFAGSRSVMASLWQVDDKATKELMSSFYKHLLATDKMEALRRAKHYLLKTPSFSHPFFWSAFNLYGMGD